MTENKLDILKIKFLFMVCLLIVLKFFFSNFAYADYLKTMSILSNKDILLYKEIFKLQRRSIKNKKSQEWKKVKILKNRLSNKILLGTILADKYLHPTGWRSSYVELSSWLEKFHDHPDAYKIHRLAKKRKPLKSKSPRTPSGNFLNGYGNISNDLLRPSFPLIKKDKKIARESFKISVKVRRSIRKKNTDYAETLLSNKNSKKYLSNIEMAQLRAELAHAYFIYNRDNDAIRQSRVSVSISGNTNALALWAGGLASWRNSDYKLSKWFFNKLSYFDKGPESILSGGRFWSAKVAYQLGKTKEINNYLKKAAEFDRTFYSTLAKSMLGYNDDLNFKLDKIKYTFLNKLKSFSGGRRIIALLQVSEHHKASREFRKIIFNFNPGEYSQIISFASENNMPGLAFRVSAILRNDFGKILLGGLYPLPNWDVDQLHINDGALLFSISRQESGFNPKAKSSANALGVMQILPSTAAFVMKNKTYRSNKYLLYDIKNNIHIGSKYIKFLLQLDLINDDVISMLASYNAGPGNFKKWTKDRFEMINDPILMIESLPARQTRNYIKLVLTNLWIYRYRLNQKPYLIPALAMGKKAYYEEFSK